jgi:acyl carrier protein
VTVDDKLRTFFVEELDLGVPKDQLGDSFVLTNRIDSMGVFDLIAFIENEFGIEVTNEELVAQHFATVGGVVRFVESKTAS